MQAIDFGQNTYQHEINFTFDCVTPDVVGRTTETLLIEKKHFTSVAKEAGTNLTALTQGLGSKESPYFQLKIGSDKLILWCGWYVSYEKWVSWRNNLLSEVLKFVELTPLEFISAVVSQAAILIPASRVRTEIPKELEPLRAVYKRFIPEELMKRGSGVSTWGDEAGKQALTWWVIPGATPGIVNCSFMLQTKQMDKREHLAENVRVHLRAFDSLFENFQLHFLPLLVK